MAELFIELGTEEIPAGYIEPACRFLERELAGFLSKSRVSSGAVTALGTPRRLAVSAADVAARQEDAVETHYGPSAAAAFDADGGYTKAALGFARGKGIDARFLSREQTAKGEVICAKIEKKGGLAADLLRAYLPRLFDAIPFPKKMRWGSNATAFARPAHWIVAVFGGETLDFEWGGLRSGNTSRGHRFLSPQPFACDGLRGYLEAGERHGVIADPERRKHMIREQAQTLAASVGGIVEEDAALLGEVAQLVEYPAALLCGFAPLYLDLPKELLSMTMKHHQRYFPVCRPDGAMLPHFIAISNMRLDKPDVVRRGNERVLRARLEDAKFFYQEDRKKKLEDFVEPLKGVVFQKSLGTLREKTSRIADLAGAVVAQVCPEHMETACRAALLCKADLVTQMVFEFPELQGVMGGYYAMHAGEAPAVAVAIKEHYRPAFAGDEPPATPAGAAVAMADKLDTILGCIGVGLIPTGSEDPYALRRHALGIIQIILRHGWQISLDHCIEAGLRPLAARLTQPREQIRRHVLDLFAQRYKSLLDAEGHPYDAIEAVLAAGVDSLLDVRKKVEAFVALKRQPYFEPLATTFRRVSSILAAEAGGAIDPGLFTQAEEKNLYGRYLEIREPAQKLLAAKDYAGVLEKIAEIKDAVDAFFDHVLVMAKEADVRDNRLRLLAAIARLFGQVADFSKIVLKKS